jgi:hypothetical protein
MAVTIASPATGGRRPAKLVQVVGLSLALLAPLAGVHAKPLGETLSNQAGKILAEKTTKRRIAGSAREVARLLRSNDRETAVRKLNELVQHATPSRSEGSALGIQTAVDEIRQLKGRTPHAEKRSGRLAGLRAGIQVRILDAPLGRVARAVEKSFFLPFGLKFVSADVARFGAAFERGTKNPEVFLAEAMRTHPMVTLQWRRPNTTKLFVAGAGKDSKQINMIKEALENEGVSAFFYDSCARIHSVPCTSEAVGAFFATADVAILVDSSSAARSDYVAIERLMAQRYAGTAPMIGIVTPEDVIQASRFGGRALVLGARASD